MFGRFLEGTHNLKRIVHVINYRLSKMAKAGSTILHPSTHDMWSLGDGKLPNLTKLVCWNVNGFRSVLKKGSLESLIQTTNPDILCFNETKVDLKAFLNDSLQSCLTGYSHYWNFCKVSSGYSGVAVCTKYKPLKVFEDFSLTNSCDNQSPESLEGRLLTLEFEKCYVVTVYKPNSGPSLNRLDFKIGYINLLKNYLLSIA
jgi:exodeoxyribonuclease-3